MQVGLGPANFFFSGYAPAKSKTTMGDESQLSSSQFSKTSGDLPQGTNLLQLSRRATYKLIPYRTKLSREKTQILCFCGATREGL